MKQWMAAQGFPWPPRKHRLLSSIRADDGGDENLIAPMLIKENLR
jgi:hypothetical protein